MVCEEYLRMKRNEFIFRLAVENKSAFVSETVDVIYNPDDSLNISERSESPSSLPSTSPLVQSLKQDLSLQSNSEIWVGGTVSDVIEEPVIKPSYEDCLETSMQCKPENDTTEPTNTNIELVLPQENGNYSDTSSTITEKGLYMTSVQKLHPPESYSPDLKIGDMLLTESLTKRPPHNKIVNIISDVILEPVVSEITRSAQYTSNLTSTVPIEYDIYNFNNEECYQMHKETRKNYSAESIVADDCINITLLAPCTPQQEFSESSSHFERESRENTDGFNSWPIYKETEYGQTRLIENNLDEESDFPQEFGNTTDEYESSGDEYIPPTDDSDEDEEDETFLSDSGSEIGIGDVHKTYSKNTKESTTTITMNENQQSEKDTPQRNYQQVESTNKANTDICTASYLGMNQRYTRKQSARERPTICPLCYEDVITHFPRHLSRHHSEDPGVKKMLSLKPNSKERLELVSAFRKRGYFILKTEKDVSHPVRSSKDSDTDHFVCTFCLGLYNKKSLYRHVKVCKSKPGDVTNPGKNCLSKSQMFMTSKNHEFLRTSRLKKEVFETMRADSVSSVAQSDPLICLYGEVLLAKHKRQQIATLVSNKIREMAKILMAIRCMHENIRGLFDVLKPEMFATFVAAVKIVSGYNEDERSFKAPSLALHMGTNLKILCNIGFKIVMEKKKIPNINWENRDEKKSDIKDLKKLIEAHWCKEISSLALKDLKEKQWQKPNQLPLSEDILLFKKYIEDICENSHESLQNNVNVKSSYKTLVECVLAQTIMFNRKRIGDVQYLKTETYVRENSSTNQKAFSESLTDLEKILCTQFKRVVTDGKGSKPVPILFSQRTQRYIQTLLNIRKSTNIVPQSNPYLFANPGIQNKWIRGDYIISKLAKKCGAKHPVLLTSTKFRKHIATTLQLLNMGTDEMEQIATFMGHTKKTHAQFYRLPQDIFQTAKVAKVLLLLEKGKGKEFRGKNLEEINLNEDDYNLDAESEEDNYEKGITGRKRKKLFNGDTDITKEIGEETGDYEISSMDENDSKVREDKMKDDQIKKRTKFETKNLIENITETQIKDEGTSCLKPINGRSRWTLAEKKLVENYFQKHIKSKTTPKKHECDQFLSKYKDTMIIKDWVKVKTFVYNTFRKK